MTVTWVFIFAAVAAPRVADGETLDLEKMVSIELHDNVVKSSPMTMYQGDCWKRRPLALIQEIQNFSAEEMIPGAGMEPESIVPFETVMKDGFFRVACIKDYLFYHGDKFGDNKFDYNQGDVSNISIVLYDEMVQRTERQPMSPHVCFEFCRTVPNMTFFGIQNGRTCYCAPFTEAMAGDDSQCDATCEGDTTQMCGSKTKSTVYEMHMCDDTALKLETLSGTLKLKEFFLTNGQTQLQQVAEGVQTAAAVLQGIFGGLGDPEASELMQTAKVYAGNLTKACDAGEELKEKIAGQLEAAATLIAGPPMDPKTLKLAEELMAKMKVIIEKAATAAFDLRSDMVATMPDFEGKAEDVEKEFYSVMYFVDKKYVGVPTTCSGEMYTHPAGGTLEGCSQQCALSSGSEKCVAFSYFPNPVTGGLCFLFSKLKSVHYYTGCPKSSQNSTAGFLQMRKAKYVPEDYQCWVKYSKFDGTTLTPDPQGKCKSCLTSATKKDACIPGGPSR